MRRSTLPPFRSGNLASCVAPSVTSVLHRPEDALFRAVCCALHRSFAYTELRLLVKRHLVTNKEEFRSV